MESSVALWWLAACVVVCWGGGVTRQFQQPHRPEQEGMAGPSDWGAGYTADETPSGTASQPVTAATPDSHTYIHTPNCAARADRNQNVLEFSRG